MLLGAVPYYMFVERDTGPKRYFEVPLARAYEIFSDACQRVSCLARTVRGPSMSATPGKIAIDGVAEVRGEKAFVLKVLQGRDPAWSNRVFFARHDADATWLDQLRPAFGATHFFFDGVLEQMKRTGAQPAWGHETHIRKRVSGQGHVSGSDRMDGASPGLPLDPRLDGLRQSATVAINEHCAALRRAGREVYRLGLGQSPFPIPERVVETLHAHAAQKAYQPVRGLETLREAVAAYHARTQRIDASPDGVLVGPGSKEPLFPLQIAFDGDILLPSPAWVSYAPRARLVGRHVVPVPTSCADGWKVTAAQLDAVCTTHRAPARLLVLNSPNDPTGLASDAPALAALAEVARRHGIIVLSDEIYGELRFDAPHCSIATFYPEGTIISGGLSRWCGAGGWARSSFPASCAGCSTRWRWLRVKPTPR